MAAEQGVFVRCCLMMLDVPISWAPQVGTWKF